MAGIRERWKLATCSRRCAHTEVKFESGESIMTTLFDDVENGGYFRRDFSLKAWKSIHEDLPKPFSQWQSTYRKETKVKPVAQHGDVVEGTFRLWLQEAEAIKSQSIYVLALMLERKKVLVEQEVKRVGDGPLLRVYEFRKTGEVCVIEDPEIALDSIQEVQIQVIGDLDFLQD